MKVRVRAKERPPAPEPRHKALGGGDNDSWNCGVARRMSGALPACHSPDFAEPANARTKSADRAKRQRLADLLEAFGSNALTPAEFWAGMAEAGLDEQDIDQYCAEEARWIPPSPNDEATTRFRRHPRPHFTCVRCGTSVHRPDSEWSDSNDVCLSCWFGRPNAE
jgi:hypothetical protein